MRRSETRLLPPRRARRVGFSDPGARRRGSTFIVVLAILSLLVLVATALSLTGRLETVSAANYAEGVQSRMAAKTGLSIAAARTVLDVSTVDGTAAAAVEAGNAAFVHPALANAGMVDLGAFLASQRVSLAEVRTLDASARVNLNTAEEETLARLFQSVAEAARAPDGEPAMLARAIVEWRGRDEISFPELRRQLEQAARTRRRADPAPGEETPGGQMPLIRAEAPDFRRCDLRVPPLDRERRFSSLSELLSLPGASPGLVAAAAPYLTVFSSSKVFADLGQGPRPLLDLNAATLEELHDALVGLYGESSKDEGLLRQFAANLVDWRDPDCVPTQFPTAPGAELVLGLERTPFLTEAWPNSIFPEETGGAGQYVELYNPWSEPIDVTGWSLQVGGARIALRGQIFPAGYLLVTDVYDGVGAGRETDSPFDSFYSIFGRVASGTGRRVLENRELRLPWTEGIHRVELRDRQGQLIDVFKYTVQTPLRGQKTSYQRLDPRIRVVTTSACSPFGFPRGVVPFVEPPEGGEERYPADRPFLARTEVLRVFAGYGKQGTGERLIGYPVLAVPASPDPALSREASSSRALDARLLDVFDVRESVLWQLARGETPDQEGAGALEKDLEAVGRRDGEQKQWVKTDAASRSARAVAELTARLKSPKERQRVEKAVAENDQETLGALAARAFLPLAADTSLGRVNVNTAPEMVLASLPGLTPDIGAGWVRERQERQARSRSLEPVVMFHRPSDLLASRAFWNADGDPARRYRRLTRLLPAITFTTSSVLMDSRTLVEEPSPSQSRHPTVSRALALVAFDRGRTEFVAWSQTP